jgi:ATP-dependent DNA helicase MPH1
MDNYSDDIAPPSKRRRISQQASSDSLQDFIESDGSDDYTPNASKRRSRSRIASPHDDDSVEEKDDEQPGPKERKPKYNFHVPKHNHVLETTITYGTQTQDTLHSSPPFLIRGPKWRLPRPKAPTPVKPTAEAAVTSRVQNDESQEALGRYHEAVMDDIGAHELNNRSMSGQPDNVSKTGPTAKVPDIQPQFSNENSFTGEPPPPSDIDLAQELADLPSDAFSSSPEPEPRAPIRTPAPPASQASRRLAAPTSGLRQTTLFGGQARVQEPVAASQANKVYNYRVDIPPEEPTHHNLDQDALNTWVYPMNIGDIRDYQYNIVRQGLFHNMLVALPTGLGKTFIAATIMLNYFRWTKDAQIVFMAPTKPLVSQQVAACFGIAGIPRSATTMLTGEISPALRAEEWQTKRVFFMTPQTLDNDLRTGIADPKKIVLLVIDEAHRATGNYSYVKLVTFMRRFSKSFRILALTATPGSSVEAVQEVIDGLEISRVEIRTENSLDIQQYTHRRKTEQVLLDPSEEIIMIKELLSKALKPLVDQLCSHNAYWNKDPMSLTAYGLMKAQETWFKSEAGRRASQGLKGMMHGLFSILGSVAHGIKLLTMHGIKPFYGVMKEFRNGVEEMGNKAGKYRKLINDSEHFDKMMRTIEAWTRKDDFVGHPKLTFLCDAILNHFLDAGDGRLADGAPPSSTRVIVFSEYRDSAEEICRMLERHRPMIRPRVFVGQANSKRSAGMNQKEQLDAISQFKDGKYNVLVATSIGEEGLDIGQVDLIICYDASGSPIRMLQRMGRTGRKRAGKIVLLLMKGKEEESYAKAVDNYEQMQKMIASGERFNLRHDLSTRIIPKDIQPVVEKKIIEIPLENTQDPSLPEPKRRAKKAAKKAPKKFHMPDGVKPGFTKASKLTNGADDSEVSEDEEPREEDELASVPDLDQIFLNAEELRELERNYQNVSGDDMQEVSFPELTNQPEAQRSLGPAKLVRHGQMAERFVTMINAMRDVDMERLDRWRALHEEFGQEALRELSQSLVSTPASSMTVTAQGTSGSSSTMRRTESLPVRHGARSGLVATSDEESLEDFVVGDDAPMSEAESDDLSDAFPSETTRAVSKPFFEPTNFNATQDTNEDGDMPDLQDLLQKSKPKPAVQPSSSEPASSIRPCVRNSRGQRRVPVMDDDSEDY